MSVIELPSSKGPVIVWIILLWYVATSVFSFYQIAVVLTGHISIAKDIFGHSVWILVATSIVANLLTLMGCFNLHRRRKYSLKIFGILLSLRFFVFIWMNTNQEVVKTFPDMRLGQLLDLFLLIFTVFYLRYLAKTGKYFSQ